MPHRHRIFFFFFFGLTSNSVTVHLQTLKVGLSRIASPDSTIQDIHRTTSATYLIREKTATGTDDLTAVLANAEQHPCPSSRGVADCDVSGRGQRRYTTILHKPADEKIKVLQWLYFRDKQCHRIVPLRILGQNIARAYCWP